ncbi:MAG: hypothetical protein AAGB34_06495, partial [Planctomycetota bacterium]
MSNTTQSSAERDALLGGPSRPKKRRSWGKRLAAVVVVLALLALGGFAILLKIASAVAPVMIEDAAARAIAGRVEVKRVSLSWGGPQIVEAQLYDPLNAPVMTAAVELDRGLIGLASSPSDLGVIRLAGEATIVEQSDGTTNLINAISSVPNSGAVSGAGTAGPPSSQTLINATVVLDSIRA